MKIAFMGKGGSGKTTLASAFIYFVKNKYKNSNIFVFDTDLNSHILGEFGYENEKINYLGTNFSEISKILEPIIEKNNISKYKIGTYPINPETNFIFPGKKHDFIEKFGIQKENITFFTVGNHLKKEKVGNGCFHEDLNGYELIINRIIDSENDYIIADSTAGADNLGTSIYMAYSCVFFIVEPTKRSIEVYQDYIKIANVNQENIFVIANKIEDEDDLDFVKKEIGKEKIIAYFKNDNEIYKSSNQEKYLNFIEKNIESLEKIDKISRENKMDFIKHYNLTYDLFELETTEWFNSLANQDLRKYFPKNTDFLKNLQK